MLTVHLDVHVRRFCACISSSFSFDDLISKLLNIITCLVCHQAYICMLLCLEDAVKQGHTKISIRTMDTDVVILATAVAQRLGCM